MKKQTKTTYVVEMGQAYRYNLPTVLKEAGATNITLPRLDESTTLVLVRCRFAGTALELQKKLWERFPMASIGVEEVKR